jgi:hypothetical protein
MVSRLSVATVIVEAMEGNHDSDCAFCVGREAGHFGDSAAPGQVDITGWSAAAGRELTALTVYAAVVEKTSRSLSPEPASAAFNASGMPQRPSCRTELDGQVERPGTGKQDNGIGGAPRPVRDWAELDLECSPGR